MASERELLKQSKLRALEKSRQEAERERFRTRLPGVNVDAPSITQTTNEMLERFDSIDDFPDEFIGPNATHVLGLQERIALARQQARRGIGHLSVLPRELLEHSIDPRMLLDELPDPNQTPGELSGPPQSLEQLVKRSRIVKQLGSLIDEPFLQELLGDPI